MKDNNNTDGNQDDNWYKKELERMAEQWKKDGESIFYSADEGSLLDNIWNKFELKFCEYCLQMTNHANGICQKCIKNERQ